MKVFLDYGMRRALEGHSDSFVRMLNGSFKYYRRLVPAPKDAHELEIYKQIASDDNLNPVLREMIQKIVSVYCGS